MSVNSLTIDVGGYTFNLNRDSTTVKQYEGDEEKPAVYYMSATPRGGITGSTPKLTVNDLKKLRDALSLIIGD